MSIIAEPLVPPHLLPDDWFSRLQSDGYYQCNLGTAPIPDNYLYSIGAELARLVPGTSASEVTIVDPIPGSTYTTLSNQYTPFHNDGLFLHKHPTYLMLYCDVQAATGGENFIIRSDHTFQRLPADLLAYLQTHKIRNTMGDYSVARHWVDQHPIDGTPVVFFVDPLLVTNVDGLPSLPAKHLPMLTRLRDVIEAGERTTLRLAVGDLLILDNYRVLHAREKFDGYRRLRRIVVRHHAISVTQ